MKIQFHLQRGNLYTPLERQPLALAAGYISSLLESTFIKQQIKYRSLAARDSGPVIGQRAPRASGCLHFFPSRVNIIINLSFFKASIHSCTGERQT